MAGTQVAVLQNRAARAVHEHRFPRALRGQTEAQPEMSKMQKAEELRKAGAAVAKYRTGHS